MRTLFTSLLFLSLVLLADCSDSNFSSTGGILGSGRKEKFGGKKSDPATDPTVVTGAYLTCEQVDPPEGSQDVEMGCNAFDSSDNRLDKSTVGQFEIKLVNSAGNLDQYRVTTNTQFDAVFKFALQMIKDVEFQLFIGSDSQPAVKVSVKQSNGRSSLFLVCGNPGNSCYDNQTAILVGKAKLYGLYNKNPRHLEYVPADTGCPASSVTPCFMIWKQIGTSQNVLNASGLVRNPATGTTDLVWQRKLAPDGRSFTTDYVRHDDDTKTWAGRACPRYTMIDDPGKPFKDVCVYYDQGSKDGGHDKGIKNIGGIAWEDGIGGRGTETWYAGNFKNCKNQGMRLPTLYETDVTIFTPNRFNRRLPYLDSSIDASCLFSAQSFPACKGGYAGVPGFTGLDYTWTATTATENGHTMDDDYFVWTDSSMDSDKYNNTGQDAKNIRCVLPSSQLAN